MARRECAVLRTGAYGDVLMASVVFPGLAALGYRLTFVTGVEGEEMLRHDPYLEGRIRVWPRIPDAEVSSHWSGLEQEFDRVVNLINAMECGVLRHPSQLSYFWPADQRRRMFGGSYLARYLEQADVSGSGRIRFTPSGDERAWVQDTKRRLGRFVMWSLRGSTVHKVYPYTPMAIMQILASFDGNIVLVGDLGARDLERQVLNAVSDFGGSSAISRVFSLVGDGSIRRALSLAQVADVVVGPETVVPMSVAHEPHVRKVVLLSHSAPSNLTDDWTNTVALNGDVPCYPCHRMHYDFAHCVQDQETGAAACAAAIPPGVIAEQILSALEMQRRAA